MKEGRGAESCGLFDVMSVATGGLTYFVGGTILTLSVPSMLCPS